MLDRVDWPLPPPAQMLLDPVAQVLHQVKAAGDLPRLWGALTRCFGVDTVTITGDQFDSGSLGQPCRGAGSRAIGQDVDHSPTFEIDRDGAEAKALLCRPFVEPDDPRSRTVGQKLVPYEMPQDGRSAAWKAQPGGQSFARPPSNAVTQQAQNAGRTLCLSRTRIHHPRKSLGEDGLLAVSVATLPSTNRQRDPHWSALDRQIPESPLIRAVPGRRDDLTLRACCRGADLFRADNPDIISQRH